MNWSLAGNTSSHLVKYSIKMIKYFLPCADNLYSNPVKGSCNWYWYQKQGTWSCLHSAKYKRDMISLVCECQLSYETTSIPWKADHVSWLYIGSLYKLHYGGLKQTHGCNNPQSLLWYNTTSI